MSTKFAIVNVYGRQFTVREGDKIQAAFAEGSDVGSSVSFNEVLFVNTGSTVKVGAPLVSGAKVTATVKAHGRQDKVLVFKYLKKNKSKKMRGHRQPFTLLSIDKIEA